MDQRMEEIYGNPEVGLEFIGESIGFDSIETRRNTEDTEKDLVSLFNEHTSTRKILEEMQRSAEAMTAEEREIYFDDLDQVIIRLCD
jgi:hypothetical protein